MDNHKKCNQQADKHQVTTEIFIKQMLSNKAMVGRARPAHSHRASALSPGVIEPSSASRSRMTSAMSSQMAPAAPAR